MKHGNNVIKLIFDKINILMSNFSFNDFNKLHFKYH